MPVCETFLPGQFCWIDLNAHDLEAASAWYGELFGWTAVTQDTNGGPPYKFFLKGDAAAAAGGQMSDEMIQGGVPPCWNNYVAVADCAASEARAVELGATVTCPTTEVPGHGKLCFVQDPGGAHVAMWESTTDAGPGVLVGEHGGLSWNELMCTDVAAARSFYGALFGWEFKDMPMGEITYTVASVEGQDVGGMMALDGPQFEGVPPHWMVYLQVDDCAATAEAAAASGGEVLHPPTEIPVGVFAVVKDPQGGVFSIIQVTGEPC